MSPGLAGTEDGEPDGGVAAEASTWIAAGAWEEAGASAAVQAPPAGAASGAPGEASGARA